MQNKCAKLVDPGRQPTNVIILIQYTIHRLAEQSNIVKRDILHKNITSEYDILHIFVAFERDILQK